MEESQLQKLRELNRAIRYENFDGVKGIKSTLSTETAWVPDPITGWTAMHFAAAQFFPTEQYKFILEIGLQAKPRSAFLEQKTMLGESVLDVFFKTRVDPQLWQRDSISLQAKRLNRLLTNSPRNEDGNEVLATFHRDLAALCETVFDNGALLPCLAQLGSSVPMCVFQWYLAIDPSSAMRYDTAGALPLHLLCRSDPPPCATSLCIFEKQTLETNRLFELVVQAYPDAIHIPDPQTGRLPMSEALRRGWSWKSIQSLSVPQCVQQAFIDASLAQGLSQDSLTFAVRQRVVGRHGMAIMWNIVKEQTKVENYESVRHHAQCASLTNIYDSLIACPEAIELVRK